MADLKDKLAQLGSIVLEKETATALSNLIKAYAKPITIKYGYVSKWELAAELVACIDPTKLPDTARQSTISSLIKEINTILQKPTPTESDAADLDDSLEELFKTDNLTSIFTGNQNQNIGATLFDRSKHPSGDNAWTGFLSFKTSWTHPTLKDGSIVYGWPNYPGKDPRQTGKVIVIDYAADNAIIEWMFINAHNYGFVWYGPTENTFIYVGNVTSEAIKNAAVNGLFATRYAFYVAEKGKGPESKEELITWLKTWQPSSNYSYHNTQQQVPLTNAAVNENWTAWQLTYNPA